MAKEWAHKSEAEDTALAFQQLGNRINTYLEMLKAGYTLAVLANQTQSFILLEQAHTVMTKFMSELEARPLWEVIDADELQ